MRIGRTQDEEQTLSVVEYFIGQGVVLVVAGLGFASAHRGIGKVHSLVNNQLDRQLRYNADLARALTDAGITVPDQGD
jgi:hypothetical protein